MTSIELSLDDLRRILAPFDLRPRAARRIAKGTVNVNFRVDTDGGAVFVRVNQGKREADLDYEGALLWHLGRRRFPTPPPLRLPSGKAWLRDGEHLITVFPWWPGAELPEGTLTVEQAGRVGECLGRLHRDAVDFPLRRAGIYTFEHIVERVEGFRGRAVEVPELAEVLPALDEEIAFQRAFASVRSSLPQGTIHGDLFPDNTLWVGERATAVASAIIDFEQASRGRFAYDLAVTLLAWCWSSQASAPRLVEGLAWALVSGYQRARPLSPAERDALWTEARLAAFRFTVTRITDVFLPSLPPLSQPARPGKDFHDYLARLRFLRMAGPDALGPILDERPPLRAV